jgi:hypothetical protein
MSIHDSMRNAVQDLLALGGLFVRTRQVLLKHVQQNGWLAQEDIHFLAERTLSHVEAMQEGFRWTLRAAEAEVDELRYVISPLIPVPDGDEEPDPRRLERPEMACMAAYLHGRVVMGMVPRVPKELTTFPDGMPYRDIWPPRSPGELKDRLEELEHGVWEIALGKPPDALYHGLHRRLYGFFEAGAWLGLQQARQLGRGAN